MSVRDYGPVPISRLKDETSQIFEALGDGRRVLISRHGLVTAAITPADPSRHTLTLALFATGDGTDQELTASAISQGSPSSFIHKAEAGVPSLVTRKNKVCGVLESITSVDDGGYDDPEFIEQREDALRKFELDHPKATPEEFAQEVERWTPRKDTARIEEALLGPRTVEKTPEPAVAFAAILDADGSARIRREDRAQILLAKGYALVAAGKDDEAEEVYETVISDYSEVPDPAISHLVTLALVSLGRLNTRQGDTTRALSELDHALARLESLGEVSL